MNYDEAILKIRELGTNGCNYDVSTDDVLAKLDEWSLKIKFEVLEVTQDSVTIHFQTLPKDTAKFAEEIYQFCPDTVDQHFGCFDEMIESFTEADEDIPEDVYQLIEGVDFSDENYGLILLERALKIDGHVQLWWD
ncbi:MAG TPA: DUF4253 domain-containing protein [Leptolyngbyaceae cyanobacterium M33_DOE_097]|uniref:DUF4253 domain-containing protein n=1 Tax=Oscillatoriales cyanobacterium SpSt-418 TaxID=2282169 RepID=A0A7C3KEB3_9CYAN|nr:DUF4253 domain-containing protein [Leptolyngbyaceae cyanobacterium M33_DOE_097]